jgi:hypothetical protein
MGKAARELIGPWTWYIIFNKPTLLEAVVLAII